jgi:hypothetical protein
VARAFASVIKAPGATNLSRAEVARFNSTVAQIPCKQMEINAP